MSLFSTGVPSGAMSQDGEASLHGSIYSVPKITATKGYHLINGVTFLMGSWVQLSFTWHLHRINYNTAL